MRVWMASAAALVAGCQWVPGSDQSRTREVEAMLLQAVPAAEIHSTWLAGSTVCGHFRDPETGRIAIFYRESGRPLVVETAAVVSPDPATIRARTAKTELATRLCYPDTVTQ